MEMFAYLKVGLSVVLCFVGAKMMLVDIYEIPIGASLGVVGAILTCSVLASVAVQWRKQGKIPSRLALKTAMRLSLRNSTSIRFARTSFLVIVLGAVLTLVKWSSISKGPSGNEAITALRVVEHQRILAERLHGSQFPKQDQVNVMLNEAWSNLQEKRYDEALLAAQNASRLLENLSGRE
jgi:hypothetical protein